jgi:erythromycin esterase-like protein
MTLYGSSEKYDRLVHEINEERAAALRRISGALESLIEQLQALGDSIPHLRASERASAIAAYRDVRRQAVRYRWYLEVQREALGLRHHQRLDEFYAIPRHPDLET